MYRESKRLIGPYRKVLRYLQDAWRVGEGEARITSDDLKVLEDVAAFLATIPSDSQ